MINQNITVVSTENDQSLTVLVYSMKEEQIEVMIGEGIHSVKCTLLPTSNGMAYAGTVMGREIVYECSREQVHNELESLKPSTRMR